MNKMMIDDICVDVIRKKIKNVHLRVYPPSGRVRISAPLRVNLATIRTFVISKMSWIKKQQKKFSNLKTKVPEKYVTGENHYYLGKRYLLKVIECNASSRLVIKHETIEMHIRPNTPFKKRKEALDGWYRQNLKKLIPEIIDRYEKIMKVSVAEFGVKKMKTKWGTCNIRAKRIWLNLELAKKPKHYLEYIVVHEMTHLLERNHNERFRAHVDNFMPQWRQYKRELTEGQML